MKLHAKDIEEGSLIEAEVLLIGGGLVSLALGNQLADAGHDVLILESGEVEPDDATQKLYEGKFTIGGPHHERQQDGYLAASRFRQFGGSGHQWGGVSLPLDPADFESRDWVPNSGWPITLEQLKPYYNRACDLLDLPHFFGDSNATPPLTVGDGRVIHSRPQRLTRVTGHVENGPFQQWLQSTLERDGVRVLLGANVTNLTLAADAQSVESVKVKTLAGRSFSARASVYVLATGGIENARLLLASNDVLPEGVGNQNDWVGRAFQGHAMVFNAFSQLLPLAPGPAWRSYVGRRRGETSYAFGTTLEAQRESRSGNFGTYLRPLPKAERNEVALHQLALRLTGQEAPGTRVLRAPFAIEHTPHRDSRVELDEDARDELGMPRVKVTWKHAAFDFEGFERAVRQLARELGLHDVARLRWNDLGQESDRFVQIGARHHMGSTRMSTDPKQGVVDTQGKVHGIGNLYIGGSSVFQRPRQPDAHHLRPDPASRRSPRQQDREDRMTLDRRALLKLLGAVTLTSAVSPALALQETVTAGAVPGLTGVEVDAIHDLAKAYEELGEDPGVQVMVERLRAASLEDDSLVGELQREMKNDFAEDRVSRPFGWHVSRTEARVLAAASQLLR